MFEKSWFVGAYLLIYLFSPFINKFLKSLTTKQITIFIFIIVLCWSIIPTFTFSNFYSSSLLRLFVFYCVGAFLAIVPNFALIKKNNSLMLLLICSAILPLSVLLIDCIGAFYDTSLFEYANRLYCANSIIVLLLCVGVIGVAKSLKPRHSKIINFIAASSLGIYLIHDNDNIRYFVWNNIFHVSNYINSNFLLLHAIVTMIIIFIGCFLIDVLRCFALEYPIMKCINRILNRKSFSGTI